MNAEHAATQAVAATRYAAHHALFMHRQGRPTALTVNEQQQEAARQALKIVTMPRICSECGRVFDLFSETDAQEWGYGHDCE